jgi:mannose-6-phosphate isomerase-like protein (cupin superfamily)
VPEGFDLASTYVHIGDDARATPVVDFQWTPEFLDAYVERFAADAPTAQLVCITPQTETWTSWERHPSGDEVVVLLSGRVDVVQDTDDGDVTISLRAGEAMVNPRNVWHRSIVHEPGNALFITPGMGTEHRPIEGSSTE